MPDNEIVRCAIYCRVSSDDQKERGTITSQITALRQLAPTLGMEIVDEYLDDGVSGTLALDKRPEGYRLMEDAKAGRFSVVLFYKVDRLARNLRYLLDTVDYFDSIKVSLKCATEPFETETLVGRMFVQLMGSFAEMERGMILERTTIGRNRVAAQGIWSGGLIPYGYRLDTEGKLTPNWTPREGYDFSEAEIIQRIFEWIGNENGTVIGSVKRLNDQGIPMWRKYQPRGRTEPDYRSTKTGTWMSSTVNAMVRAPVYKGVHIFKGGIEREVTPLVDEETWDRAQAQLLSNRNLSDRGNRQYLLRGLITCADCGATYSGMFRSHRYYRCSSQLSSNKTSSGISCDAKMIRADWVEDLVWDDVKAFVMNPGAVLEQLKATMESELANVPQIEERRKELERILRLKEAENDRMIDAYRHGTINLDALDDHIKRSKLEVEPIQAEYMTLMGEEAERGKTVGDIANTEELLRTLQDTISSRALDWETRRAVIEGLVSGIQVETTGTKRKKKSKISVTYNFEPVCAVATPTPTGPFHPG